MMPVIQRQISTERLAKMENHILQQHKKKQQEAIDHKNIYTDTHLDSDKNNTSIVSLISQDKETFMKAQPHQILKYAFKLVDQGDVKNTCALIDRVKDLHGKKAYLELMCAKNEMETSLLCWATRQNHPQVVSLLIEKNADLEQKNGPSGITALTQAAWKPKECYESLKTLLDEKADPNSESKDGYFTALSVAVSMKGINTIRALLAAKANPTKKTLRGSALDLAVQLNNFEIIDMLRNDIEKTAGIEKREQGRAIFMSELKTYKLQRLYDQLANENIASVDELTCLDNSSVMSLIQTLQKKTDITASEADLVKKMWTAAINGEFSIKGEFKDGKVVVDCGICFDEIDRSRVPVTDCKHIFCQECWTQYLEVNIKDGNIKKLKCPDPECDRKVSDKEIEKLVDEQTIRKYKKFKLNLEVAKDPNKRWCLTPDCLGVLTKPGITSRKAECKICNQGMCWSCGLEYHIFSCKKAAEDSKHAAFLAYKILNNVKHCPQCDSSVEKTSGCNHMTCYTCGYEFCWMCRGK